MLLVFNINEYFKLWPNINKLIRDMLKLQLSFVEFCVDTLLVSQSWPI